MGLKSHGEEAFFRVGWLGNLGGVWGREIPYEEAFGQAQNAPTPVGAQYAFARYYGWGAEGVDQGPLGL